MANSWGFDGSQNHPPHMSAWSKYILGWITPTVVSSSGTFSLRQACDNKDMLMINEGYPSGEYLLIENRQPCGFETAIGQGGLVMYHIDSNANNFVGYPQQPEWPQNANHYKVAVLQAESSYGLEKGLDRGDSRDIFHAGDVFSIGPDGTSAGEAYPNTKSYQDGNIIDTGVTILNIGAAGETMTFDVSIGTTASPTESPTESPTASPSVPCDNFPNVFVVLYSGGSKKKKSCNGAIKNIQLCIQNGVDEICPSACGTCSTCADTSLSFFVDIRGVERKKTCTWAAGNPNVRCGLNPAIKLACRSTCGNC